MSGSDLVTFTKINLALRAPLNEFQRRPIVHACDPLMEIPSAYDNSFELKEDFANILSYGRFGMDFT